MSIQNLEQAFSTVKKGHQDFSVDDANYTSAKTYLTQAINERTKSRSFLKKAIADMKNIIKEVERNI